MNIEEILRPKFSALGFEIIHLNPHDGTNGPDAWVKKRMEDR